MLELLLIEVTDVRSIIDRGHCVGQICVLIEVTVLELLLIEVTVLELLLIEVTV